MSARTFERLTTGKDGVEAVSVGPLRLLARNDSYTLAKDLLWKMDEKIEVKTKGKSKREARKAVIDAAREQLAKWGAELDELALQERG